MADAVAVDAVVAVAGSVEMPVNPLTALHSADAGAAAASTTAPCSSAKSVSSGSRVSSMSNGPPCPSSSAATTRRQAAVVAGAAAAFMTAPCSSAVNDCALQQRVVGEQRQPRVVSKQRSSMCIFRLRRHASSGSRRRRKSCRPEAPKIQGPPWLMGHGPWCLMYRYFPGLGF
uniref:Uncharacterized protein n=2 Tax=Oryza sativa subsp. japonica TaxID=39947 RepID=Q5Z945_ORYSJ|nr:hypothetical protein [Oryza sativa Japonica Group]